MRHQWYDVWFNYHKWIMCSFQKPKYRPRHSANVNTKRDQSMDLLRITFGDHWKPHMDTSIWEVLFSKSTSCLFDHTVNSLIIFFSSFFGRETTGNSGKSTECLIRQIWTWTLSVLITSCGWLQQVFSPSVSFCSVLCIMNISIP